MILNRFFFFLNSSVSLSCKACFDFNDTCAAGVEEGDLEDELLSSDLRLVVPELEEDGAMVMGVYVFNSDDDKGEGFHFCCCHRKVKGDG